MAATLKYQLRVMCKRSTVGSYATQSNRYCALQLIAKQLTLLGYKLKNAQNIKPKHIEALTKFWNGETINGQEQKPLAIGTIKNRMSNLRFWAENVGKSSIMHKDNETYGIPHRQFYKGSKAQQLDLHKITNIKCERVKMAVRLQAAFGLRREEALKFRPSFADKGNKIALKATWTKGGRAREIPITNERQRSLLNEAHELVGAGSLIPDNKTYIQQLNTYKHEIASAHLGKLHGLRHNYAQWRYKVLTGMKPPANGGEKYKDMSEQEKLMDTIAREQISAELGHGRLDVTNTYLGGRS